MSSAPRKKFRDRAMRARCALEKEKASLGGVSDGGGKRYRIGVFFLLAGDLENAVAAFDAFYKDFPDDIGEPVFFLYGALAAYRQGDLVRARRRLMEAMLENLFLLPHLMGLAFNMPGVWHPSNRHQRSYLREVEEFLDEPTSEERLWIASEWNSDVFTKLRDGYVATHGALNTQHDPIRRMLIIQNWERLQAKYVPRES